MSRSNFPNSVDSLPELSNILASDAANITRYQQLLTQTTLTSAEQTELNNLKTTLATKLVDAEYFNFLSDAITAVQNYFLNTVMADIAKTDVGTLRNDMGYPSELVTNDKSSITHAINEIKQQLNFDEVENDLKYAVGNRSINHGTGLTGGGNLTQDVTLSFDTTWGDNRYGVVSGSNAFGSYVKFPDGTMICYVTKNIQSYDTSSSNNYINFDNQMFPMLFASNPTCTISAYSSYSGFAANSTNQTFIIPLNAYSYRYGVQFSGNQNTGGTWYVQIAAYGRWK